MEEKEKKEFEEFKKIKEKKQKVIELKGQRSSLFKEIDAIGKEIEKIEPKQARAYGDPLVEFF